MVASTPSPPNRLDPPEALLIRTVQVGTDVLNTIRVPGDPFTDKRKSLFKTEFDSGNEKKEMPTIHEGNEVKYLIDGKETFKEMVAAIRTATGISKTEEKANHFIYMLNWWMDKDFELVSEEPGVNLSCLLYQASYDKGVMVRAMLWNQQFTTQNSAEVDYINSLDNGAAILDSRGNEDLPPFSWLGIPFLPI